MKIPFVGNSPIRKTIVAHLYGVGVQLVNQVLLVPFYIMFWGKDLYSDWIVLSALTIFFAMSDVGLNNVIQNRFSIKFAEGNEKECRSLITDNFILVLSTMVLTFIVLSIFVLTFDITQVMSLHFLSRTSANLILLFFIFKAFLGMFSGIENSIYRATHNASRSVFIDNTIRAVEVVITIVCLYLHCDLVLISIFLCIPYLFLIVWKYRDCKKYYNYSFSWESADWPLFKGILMPSLSFMSFPVGNAIIMQGYTILVNKYFNADSVVLYNTTRTLCNFIKQLLNTLQNSVWPEYSIAYGKSDFALMRHLHRKILKATVVLSLSTIVGILLFGPWAFRIWTNNSVEFSYSLMSVYLIVLFVESLWTSSSVTLMATNNHSKLGYLFVIMSTISLGIAFLISSYHCLWIVASTLLLIHIVVSFYAIKAGFELTKDVFWKK